MLCHLLKAIKYSQAKEPNDSTMKKMELLFKPSRFLERRAGGGGFRFQVSCQRMLK